MLTQIVSCEVFFFFLFRPASSLVGLLEQRAAVSALVATATAATAATAAERVRPRSVRAVRMPRVYPVARVRLVRRRYLWRRRRFSPIGCGRSGRRTAAGWPSGGVLSRGLGRERTGRARVSTSGRAPPPRRAQSVYAYRRCPYDTTSDVYSLF